MYPSYAVRTFARSIKHFHPIRKKEETKRERESGIKNIGKKKQFRQHKSRATGCKTQGSCSACKREPDNECIDRARERESRVTQGRRRRKKKNHRSCTGVRSIGNAKSGAKSRRWKRHRVVYLLYRFSKREPFFALSPRFYSSSSLCFSMVFWVKNRKKKKINFSRESYRFYGGVSVLTCDRGPISRILSFRDVKSSVMTSGKRSRENVYL